MGRLTSVRTTYRRRLLEERWHFCTNCSGWPRHDFLNSLDPPRDEDLCPECEEKRRAGECA